MKKIKFEELGISKVLDIIIKICFEENLISGTKTKENFLLNSNEKQENGENCDQVGKKK